MCVVWHPCEDTCEANRDSRGSMRTGDHSALEINSLSFTSKAHARAFATSIPTLTFPNSTDEI